MYQETDYQFYPTPPEIVEKMIEKCGDMLRRDVNILEPSAGKGNIADAIDGKIEKISNFRSKIDVIELDSNLQKILIGKGHRLVFDDFLRFETFKKYDLVVMNPPFSGGEKHLLGAIELMKDGGRIVCLLNEGKITDPNTKEKKYLLQRLEELNADIEYLDSCFSEAERKTKVKVVLITIDIPKAEKICHIFENVKKSYLEKAEKKRENYSIEKTDPVEMLMDRFNLEIETGVRLIQEHEGFSEIEFVPVHEKEKIWTKPVFSLSGACDINSFVKQTRQKYWKVLFNSGGFSKYLTELSRKTLFEKLEEFGDYDFNAFNIKQVQINLIENVGKSIKDSVLDMFDKITRHAIYDGGKNIHYFNGWKTNDAYKVGEKAVVPYLNAFDPFDGEYNPTRTSDFLIDLEKALNYLDGEISESNVYERLKEAKETGQTKNVDFRHFDVTFYKKGTAHIRFKSEDLLKKFNLLAARKKSWLPPTYGKISYDEMGDEEKAVIDSFEGKSEYTEAFAAGKLIELKGQNLLC